MYCPACKNFNDVDFDPVENMRQFMKFVDQEDKKWNLHKIRTSSSKGRSRKGSKSAKRSASKDKKSEDKVTEKNDSLSDITDMDKEQII